MTVHMNDGWRGRVAKDNGEMIVCVCSGESPDPYRPVIRRFVTIDGSNKLVVDWKGQKANGERVRRVFDRVRLETEWESAPS